MSSSLNHAEQNKVKQNNAKQNSAKHPNARTAASHLRAASHPTTPSDTRSHQTGKFKRHKPAHASAHATTHALSQQKTPSRMNARYIVSLCAVCLVAFFCVNACYFLAGKLPLWRPDALSQYLNYFIWEGEALRTWASDALSGTFRPLPQYLFTMGYGTDIVAAMSGTINDPLNLLSGFCPRKYTPYLFTALIYVRTVLSALTFSYYCLKRGNTRSASFVASLCYAFGGFMVFWAMTRHPFFLNAVILLPLILAGADDLFQKRRSTLFVIALALQFIVSVYFSYMSCLALLVYCLIAYFFTPRNRSAADFFKLVGAAASRVVLALALAAFIALPVVLDLTSIGRVGAQDYIPLLFEPVHYAVIPANILGGIVYRNGGVLGAVAVIALVIFFCARKQFDKAKHRAWSIGLILVAACYAIPYLSHVIHGMGYATDRWMYAGMFCVSYVVCLVVPALSRLSSQEQKRCIIAVIVIALLSCISLYTRSRIGVACMTLFFVIAAFLIIKRPFKLTTKTASAALSILVIIGIAGSITFTYYPHGKGALAYYGSAKSDVSSIMRGSRAALVPDYPEGEPYRTSLPGRSGAQKNASVNHDALLLDFYTSFYNQSIDDFRTGLGISDDFFSYRFTGNDSRLALDAFSGARYFVADNDDQWRVPYSYHQEATKSKRYSLWTTDHALPLAFTSTTLMEASAYEELDMVAKQDALLQACVVDNAQTLAQTLDLAHIQPQTQARDVPYSIKAGKDALVEEDGSLVALSENAYFTLSFKGLPQSETYVVLDNLELEGISPRDCAELLDQDTSGIINWIEHVAYVAPARTSISVDVPAGTKYLEFGTPKSVGYGGKTSWVLNLGYTTQPQSSATVRFSKPGRYSTDSFRVVCEPTHEIVTQLDTLATYSAQNVYLGDNSVQINTSTTAPNGILMVSIPYSNGWSATVDGKQANIIRTDIAFMGIALDAGAHEIKLAYHTPGLTTGCAISGVALVIAILWLVLRRRADQRKK